MKTVKSTEELKRLALARGAGASFSGGQFNVGASRVSTERQTEGKQKADATPEPKPAWRMKVCRDELGRIESIDVFRVE